MNSNSLTLLKDVSLLEPELKSRLPNSANVFNMAKFYPKFKTEIQFYTLDVGINAGTVVGANTWIFVIYQRKDFGQDISISAPIDPFKVFSPEEIKTAFMESKLIDWDKAYHFTTLDRAISQPFYELSCNVNGNVTVVIPDYFYYLEPEVAAALEINESRFTKEMQVKSIDSAQGIVFLKKTWKHAAPDCDDYLTNLLQRNESRGVYVNGEIVSGIIFNGTGFLAMLHTLPEVRRQGFGKICMRDLISSLGKNGYVPCCSVDIKNTTSHAFQISVGLKKSHIVDYILHCPEKFD